MILGVHSAGHDTGAALVHGGRPITAMESERLTRMRHESRVGPALDYLHRQFPTELEASTTLALSTPVRFGAFGVAHAEDAVDNLDFDNPVFHTTATISGRPRECDVILHEYCHAACALYSAGWRAGTLVVINEGHGTRSRNATFFFDGRHLRLCAVNELPWYASGFGWNAIAHLAGYRVTPSIAGTLMALGGYGTYSARCADALLGVALNVWDASRQAQIEAAEQVRRVALPSNCHQELVDLVCTLQTLFTAELVEHVTRWSGRLHPVALALGGGCALNIVANSRLRAQFREVSIWPACNDAGVSLGAALWSSFMRGEVCGGEVANPRMIGSVADLEINAASWSSSGWRREELDLARVVGLLGSGGVVAWASGRAAVGPRSLGERSFLASPTIPGTRKLVSETIKRRAWFRPLSPVVRSETFRALLPNQPESPFMLFQYGARNLAWPEATHVDGSARIQTVSRDDHTVVHALLQECERAGVSDSLINTSLNLRGEAIALTAEDVRSTLDGTPEVRAVVIGNAFFTR